MTDSIPIEQQRYLVNPMFGGAIYTEHEWLHGLDDWFSDEEGMSREEQLSILFEHDFQLHCASYFGNLVYVRYLLDQGADIECQDDDGQTPLHVAVLGQRLHVMRELVRRGADIHVLDPDDRSPWDLCQTLEQRAILWPNYNAS